MCLKGVVPKLLCSLHVCLCRHALRLPERAGKAICHQAGGAEDLQVFSSPVFICWCWALSGTDSVRQSDGDENEWWKPFFFPLF